MITRVRGNPNVGPRQEEFHVTPIVVRGGDESYVLVEKGRVVYSTPQTIIEISSFLGVMPGDIVEMAIDVVDLDNGLVLYTRSIHKEDYGIYDAWHSKVVDYDTSGLEIVVTCRVNDVNRENKMEALFEGLVRIEVQ
jgi:hypothetical protein